MTEFPLARTLPGARAPDVPKARTEDAAQHYFEGPVYLAVEEWPESFLSLDEAEAAAPDLYGGGVLEPVFRDGVWRIAMRYWRPAPPAPAARTVQAAARKPLGHARTPEEARAILGAPAELVSGTLPRLYANHQALQKKWGEQIACGLAEIVERDSKFAVSLRYWRAMSMPGTHAPLTPGEREELAQRGAAPMRGSLPQSPLDIGLFETAAPENPDIILAEEGDGRFHGDWASGVREPDAKD